MLCEHDNVAPCVQCDIEPLEKENQRLQAQVAQLKLLVVDAFESGYYDGAGDDLWYADHDSADGELTETASIHGPMKEFLDGVEDGVL